MARVFVAVPISSELQKEILGWEGGFQKLPVRWLSGKNLHIIQVYKKGDRKWKINIDLRFQ